MDRPLVTGVAYIDRMNLPLTIVIPIVVIALALLVLAGFYWLRYSRANAMRERDADLRTAEMSDELRASRDTETRRELQGSPSRKIRVIRALSIDEKRRFTEAWTKTQANFIDSPHGAVSRADNLLGEVMRAKGYPVSDFEEKAAALSADHPVVVKEYRAAHAAALHRDGPGAGTEDLRRAMVHYRILFEALANDASDTRAAV
jgi:hypothetical protein